MLVSSLIYTQGMEGERNGGMGGWMKSVVFPQIFWVLWLLLITRTIWIPPLVQRYWGLLPDLHYHSDYLSHWLISGTVLGLTSNVNSHQNNISGIINGATDIRGVMKIPVTSVYKPRFSLNRKGNWLNTDNTIKNQCTMPCVHLSECLYTTKLKAHNCLECFYIM